jgi:hypothetical protein
MNLAMETAQTTLTDSEREHAASYLAETKHALLREIDTLSETQWNFKPAPELWSVTDIVEHLAIVAHRVLDILARMPTAPAAPSDHDARKFDQTIVRATAQTTAKFQAPSVICPTGSITPAAALEQFLASDREMKDALHSSPALRGHVISHPVAGALDGYQWILLVSAHIARHTTQIIEMKASADFPPK